MTGDEAVALLDSVGYLTMIACDEGDFYVYSCPVSRDGLLDTDDQTDASKRCATIEQALEAYGLQFSRGE